MSEISNKEHHTLPKQTPDPETHTLVTPELKAPEIKSPEIKSSMKPKIINELKSKPMTTQPTSPDFLTPENQPAPYHSPNFRTPETTKLPEDDGDGLDLDDKAVENLVYNIY